MSSLLTSRFIWAVWVALFRWVDWFFTENTEVPSNAVRGFNIQEDCRVQRRRTTIHANKRDSKTVAMARCQWIVLGTSLKGNLIYGSTNGAGWNFASRDPDFHPNTIWDLIGVSMNFSGNHWNARATMSIPQHHFCQRMVLIATSCYVTVNPNRAWCYFMIWDKRLALLPIIFVQIVTT